MPFFELPVTYDPEDNNSWEEILWCRHRALEPMWVMQFFTPSGRELLILTPSYIFPFMVDQFPPAQRTPTIYSHFEFTSRVTALFSEL